MMPIKVLVGITDITNNLKSLLSRFNSSVSFMDLTHITEHYVDCYMYGSMYAQYTIDPIDELFSSLSVPTDYRAYIKTELSTAVVLLIDEAMRGLSPADASFVISWLPRGVGVIEEV